LDQTTEVDTSTFERAAARGIHQNVVSLLSQRSDLAGKLVIDLACGDGRTTYFLRSKGANVTPYDLFTDRYKLSDKPIHLDIQKSTTIPSESAELIIFQEVLEHLPNQLFALKEIYRILKPGGEVLLTTPNRSSLASKLSFLLFESETMKLTPWGSTNSVWQADPENKESVYYGHVWLVGYQQLRTMALLAGFKKMEIERSELSKTSAFLTIFFYLPIVLVSLRATFRSYSRTLDKSMRSEFIEQLKLNVNPLNLINKFLIVTLRK
jgi:SAM-dependent methyltransferase